MKRQRADTSPSQRCPNCDAVVTADAINIQEGVALCPSCGILSRLSELITSGRSVSDTMDQPPRGCTIESDGQRMIVSASLRTFAGVVFPAMFALFWNSIVSVFVLVAFAGLYANLIGPLPDWFPAPDMQDGKPKMNDAPMGLGMTLFLCVFLIPFVTIGIGMASIAIINLFGSIKVIIDPDASFVATGVGFARWKKRFDAREVESVKLGSTPWQSGDGSNSLITIKGQQTVKFGSLLPSSRQEWMHVALRQILVRRGPAVGLAKLPNLPWLPNRSG